MTSQLNAAVFQWPHSQEASTQVLLLIFGSVRSSGCHFVRMSVHLCGTNLGIWSVYEQVMGINLDSLVLESFGLDFLLLDVLFTFILSKLDFKLNLRHLMDYLQENHLLVKEIIRASKLGLPFSSTTTLLMVK